MKYISIILYVIFLSGFNQECFLAKAIIKRQKKTLNEINDRELKHIYKDIVNEKKLKLLFKELKEQGEVIREFKIVESYHILRGKQLGVVWNDSFAYTFSFNSINRQISLHKKNQDFSDYFPSINLSIEVIKFLNEASNKGIAINVEDIPMVNKGGNLFCVFSDVRISNKNYAVNTFFFQER